MAKFTVKENQLRRCLQIALYFESTGEKLEPAELYRKFYPDHKEETAKTTFKRDRDELAKHGFVFEYDSKNPAWSLKKFERLLRLPVLSDHDAAALAIAASPMLYEESFPLPFALRFALAKLTSSNLKSTLEFEDDLMVRTKLTLDDNAELQRDVCARCIKALEEMREIRFTYQRPGGEPRERSGLVRCLHFFNGQWYVLLSDSHDLSTYITYSVSNITELEFGKSHTGLNLPPIGTDHIFPFFWDGLPDSHEPREVTLIIPAHLSEQKDALTLGLGELDVAASKSEDARGKNDLSWKIMYRNQRMLFHYILERGLSISAESPRERAALLEYLESVVQANE